MHIYINTIQKSRTAISIFIAFLTQIVVYMHEQSYT